MKRNPAVMAVFGAMGGLLAVSLIQSAAAEPASMSQVVDRSAEVSVNFDKSIGAFLHPERFNNLSGTTIFEAQRSRDVKFYNQQGLHGQIYRVWIRAQDIFDPKTGQYEYGAISGYLSDVSSLSDNLLAVMDTRVAIRDQHETPAQIKPVIKKIMYDLKKRFPHIRYIEAFNEPDYNLAEVLKPEQLYDYYKVYYAAVDEINRELKPEVPLEVGGPAFMAYNDEWLRAFLDRYKSDPSPDKRLDFISWHAYGEFPGGFHGTQGPRAYHFYKGDPSEVSGQRAKLDAELRSHGLNVDMPAFITELGVYPGPSFDHPKDPHADYIIQAAGVSSLLYWFMEQPHTVPFNWVLRHHTEERKDELLTRAGKGQPVPTDTFTPYGNAMLMMSKLKNERVVAHTSALANGKGVYAIATKDQTGVAVMIWNYQHTDAQSYLVRIDMQHLPAHLQGKLLRQRSFRIDNKVSNYWGDPARANLQQVADTTLKPGEQYDMSVDLTPNSLELVVLELAEPTAK